MTENSSSGEASVTNVKASIEGASVNGEPAEVVMVTHNFTDDEIAEAARNLVSRGDAEAQRGAQIAAMQNPRGRGKGYSMVLYPELIPDLDRAAFDLLVKEGHEATISKGLFANSIVFPGREVITTRG